MKLWTSSRAKDARACQRLHHLKFDLGYRPVREDDVLRFGSLIHKGEEAWWLHYTEPSDVRLKVALEAMAGEADPFERAKAEVMMIGYDARWGSEPFRVLDVEAEFRAPLINPATGAASRTWELGGKLDVTIWDRRDELTKLVEHKTTSESIEAGSEYFRRLRMDGQISVYFDGAKARGHDIAECIYDVLAKPALKMSQVPLVDDAGVKIVLDAAGQRVRIQSGKKWRETGDSAQGYVLQTRDETADEFRARLVEAVSATPDRYFARATVVRLESELEEARFDAWQTSKQIHEGELAGRFPRNPDSCSRYGRTCAFFDVCSGAASLDDPALFKRSTNVHPELEESHDNNSRSAAAP